MQSFEFKLPETYQPYSFPGMDNMPEDARFFRAQEENCESILVCFAVDEAQAMPFGGDDLSEQLRGEISRSERLLFSKREHTAGGFPFVCDVLKRQNEGSEEYMFNLNLRIGEDIYYLGGRFFGGCSPQTVKDFYEFIVKNN